MCWATYTDFHVGGSIQGIEVVVYIAYEDAERRIVSTSRESSFQINFIRVVRGNIVGSACMMKRGMNRTSELDHTAMMRQSEGVIRTTRSIKAKKVGI